MSGWDQHWILRDVGDGATAVGRSWGRERPGLVDVLQHLADPATPTGAGLTAAGLGEPALIAWRRGRDDAAPLLTLDRVPVTPEVDDLLARVHRDVRPLLHRDIGQAAVASAVLGAHDDAELTAALTGLGVDLTTSADGVVVPAAAARPLVTFSVYERLGVLAFVPTAATAGGGRRELPGLATTLEPDAAPAAVGEHTLGCLARHDREPATDAPPFWTALGHRTESAFLRRSRLVMGSGRDGALRLHATVHSARSRFDSLTSTTGIHVPTDATDAVGAAVLAAIAASRG